MLLPSLAALPVAACSLVGSGGGAYRGPVSGHFDGERFFNPGGAPPRGFGDLVRWQLGGGRAAWPDEFPSPVPPDRPPARVERGLRVTFVGHATFLIQADGLNLLTDPVWSERASPASWIGPRRHNPPGIAFDDLPPIHAVLVSHGHYDHLDAATLRRLWRRDRPMVVAPLGQDAAIREEDGQIAVRSVDWGDEVALGPAATVFTEPAHHWSARGLGDRNRALWAAFVVRTASGTIYFAGDTGFAQGRTFAATAARHPSMDLALLPIGAYEPRWFMAEQHMNPDEAVQALGILGASHALGYHWGTFQLTNEAVDAPPRDLAAALQTHGVPAERFAAARPGQVWQAETG